MGTYGPMRGGNKRFVTKELGKSKRRTRIYFKAKLCRCSSLRLISYIKNIFCSRKFPESVFKSVQFPEKYLKDVKEQVFFERKQHFEDFSKTIDAQSPIFMQINARKQLKIDSD